MDERDSRSVSLSGMYSWKDVEEEAERLNKTRSYVVQEGVNHYFLHKNRSRIKTNYTHIVLGIILVIVSLNFVLGVL